MTEVHVSDEELRKRAEKRVEEIRGFWIHLGVYLIVNLALMAINLLTTPDVLWFVWPMIGWGIGLAIHAFTLLTEGPLLGPEWERRKVDQIMERESRRGSRNG